MLRLTRWRYKCGQCRQYYDLPGIDLSFFHGWFLGVSPSREAVVFDTLSFPGFAEVIAILDALRDELPAEHAGALTSKALSEVSDPDSHGWKYIFTGTPGCPVCTSTKLADFAGTEEPWPHPAAEATHSVWDGMSHQERVDRVRVALGLHEPDVPPDAHLSHARQAYQRVVADCASALLSGGPAEQCRSRALAELDAATAEALERIDEYLTQPFLPANTRWVLVTKLERLRRRALDDLRALAVSGGRRTMPHL